MASWEVTPPVTLEVDMEPDLETEAKKAADAAGLSLNDWIIGAVGIHINRTNASLFETGSRST